MHAMSCADLGDDVFGDDPTVNRLEALAAQITGKEKALFVPSGTMGNQIAIRVHTRPGDEVLVEESSHTFLYEGGGIAALSLAQTWPLRNERGLPSINQIQQALRPDDPHCPRSSLLCLENTHNRYGGRVVPLDEMEEVSGFARKSGLRIHLDGARIFHAHVHADIPVSAYAACADSMMFCLSKGLCAPVGSMLVGTDEFIASARRMRKMFGGGMRQAGILAAAGLISLEEMVGRLEKDHARAKTLAEALSPLPGIDLTPKDVHTNIVLLNLRPEELPSTVQTAQDLIQRLLEEDVAAFMFGDRVVRLVTHKDVGDADVERAIRAFQKILLSKSA